MGDKSLAEKRGDDRSLALLHSNFGLVGGFLPRDVRAGAYREAVRFAERAGDPSLQISVGCAVGPMSMIGFVEESLERVEELVELGRTTDVERGALHFDPKLWLATIRGFLLTVLGRIEEGVAQSGAAVERARERGEPLEQFLAHVYHATVQLLVGGFDSALDHGRRSYDLPPAVERLVSLYEKWGKTELTVEWKARLAETASTTVPSPP